MLDTWFSSALWPFATLGWPEQTEDLTRHYPNDVLISGFDILFFWDARMAMQGIEFMKEVPWKTLYLHGLVRDAHGQKMSKSKGNTVDPLGLIDHYGADALRFTMAAMESQGRDIKLDEKRVEGYRNFATKLWNAARFLPGQWRRRERRASPRRRPSCAVNRWIIGEVVETLGQLDKAIADLRFDEMADAIYHFTWGTFCDWYVELVKGAWDDETTRRRRLGVRPDPRHAPPVHAVRHRGTVALDGRAAVRADRRQMAGAGGEARCRGERAKSAGWSSSSAKSRAMRTELNIPWSVNAGAASSSAAIARRSNESCVNAPTLARMAKLDLAVGERNRARRLGADRRRRRDLSPSRWPERSTSTPSARACRRPSRRPRRIATRLAARLGNPSFTERAKPEAVEKARADHDARAAEAERLAAALARLG